MTTWTEIAVLPNLKIEDAIDSRFIALVPRHDGRVIEIEKTHPKFRRFISGFTDAFGVKISPTVMLRHRDAPQRIWTMEAAASFRDLISLSVVPLNRALEIIYPRRHRLTWSNAFWIYPWMIDKNDEYLISSTPAQLALHLPEEFHGQSTPELPQMTLRGHDVDMSLLLELTRRWERRYTAPHPKWEDRALFRSLNMAHQAAALPAGADATLHDFGRLVALWVSAFEILVHPKTSQANMRIVCDLLDKVRWQAKGAGNRRYKALRQKTDIAMRYPMAIWIYTKLYRARNDFIHGNPISAKQMLLPKSKLPITRFAAPSYRLALTSFLQLAWHQAMPKAERPEELGKFISDRMSFYHGQQIAERALLAANLPQKDDED